MIQSPLQSRDDCTKIYDGKIVQRDVGLWIVANLISGDAVDGVVHRTVERSSGNAERFFRSPVESAMGWWPTCGVWDDLALNSESKDRHCLAGLSGVASSERALHIESSARSHGLRQRIDPAFGRILASAAGRMS